MFNKLLIANRGAIACRILRTLRALDVQGVAVYSEADAASLHIQQADEAHSLGEGPAANTYLVVEKILAVAKQTGAKALGRGETLGRRVAAARRRASRDKPCSADDQ